VADTTVTTASFPTEQLVPRINRICREGWPVIVDNLHQFRGWQDPKDTAKKRFTEAVQLSVTAGIDFHIFDIIYQQGAPPGKEGEVEEIIGSMQSAVERAQKGLAPASSPSQVVTLFGDFNQRAQRFGLDDCPVEAKYLR
jgi:hypothetical protein